VWEEAFKVVTDSGKVIVNRFGIDVMTHVDCEETHGFGSGVDGFVVKMAETKVRISSRIVR
jgi:hypothetical protein